MKDKVMGKRKLRNTASRVLRGSLICVLKLPKIKTKVALE